MITRREIITSSAALALTGCSTPPRSGAKVHEPSFALAPKGRLCIRHPGITTPVRFFVVGDTHLGLADERDRVYADNYARMARCSAATKPDALAKTLRNAREARADMTVLVGDNISFPSWANIDRIHNDLTTAGINWMYTAGNHDWHFEGTPGSDIAQRKEWIKNRLGCLYQGKDPLMDSRLVKGVRFVTIDDSAYHILPEQLAFWKHEAAKGDPLVLFMHIPLWTPEWGLFTCGCPEWGAVNDPYWQIERRERWAERQTPESFAFREAVLSEPNLIGVFTGHIHQLMAAQVNGKLMFSVPANRDGSLFDVTLSPPEACSTRAS